MTQKLNISLAVAVPYKEGYLCGSLGQSLVQEARKKGITQPHNVTNLNVHLACTDKFIAFAYAGNGSNLAPIIGDQPINLGTAKQLSEVAAKSKGLLVQLKVMFKDNLFVVDQSWRPAGMELSKHGAKLYLIVIWPVVENKQMFKLTGAILCDLAAKEPMLGLAAAENPLMASMHPARREKAAKKGKKKVLKKKKPQSHFTKRGFAAPKAGQKKSFFELSGAQRYL